MQQRTVLVAPRSQRPVLDALVDLSAAGALDPFTWIEAPSAPERAADREDPRAVQVEDGTVRATTFSTAVNVRGLRKLRMVVVVPVGHEAQDALESSAENFYQNLDIPGGAERYHVRVLVPWTAEPLPAQLGRAGWYDVMLSPESTAEPEFSAVPWWNHPETIPGSAASGIAVQAGLLKGLESAPFDDHGADISADVSMVRTFIRRIDATEVESALRTRVLAMGETVPSPTRAGGSSVPPFPAPAAQVQETSAAWTRRHEPAVRRPGPQVPASSSGTIGVLAALRLFFSFLLRAVLGAPEAWLRRTLHTAQSGLAAGATRMIFGKDSPVEVIVGGVGADGSTASWRSIQDAARAVDLGPGTEEARRGQPARRDFSLLWTDLLAGSRSLLDGSSCPELHLDGAVGYVPQRSLVAPGLDTGGTFTISEPVGALSSVREVRAWDHLEIARVRGILERSAVENDPRAAGARRQLAELESWRAATERSFVPSIGRTIAGWFDATRQEIAAYRHELDSLLQPEVDEQLSRTQHRLAWLLRGLFAGMLIVLVVLGVLGAKEVIGLVAMGTSMAVCVLLWLLVSFAVFALLQREVFRLLHLQRERDQRVPVLMERLRMAVEDLDSLGEAYSQFDQWALLLTSFLAEPLGGTDTAASTTRRAVELPKALQMPTVHVAPSALDEAAARLRMRSFGVGWLGLAFEDFLRSAADDLTPEQRVRMRESGVSPLAQMLSSGAAADGELGRWARSTAEKGVRTARGETIWEGCTELLEREPMLDLAVVRGQGEEAPESVGALRSELWDARSASIVDEVLQLSARTVGTRMVDPTFSWRRLESEGMSSDIVLVQSTRPIAPESFIYPEAGRPHEQGLPMQPDDIVF